MLIAVFFFNFSVIQICIGAVYIFRSYFYSGI